MDLATAGIESSLPFVLLWIFVVGGTIGSVIPACPGALLILTGSLLHGFLTGWDPLGVLVQSTLGVMTVLSWGVSYAITALGAKRYGASNWGIGGATVGMVGGIFLPLPIIGPLVGAFVGALVMEVGFGNKDNEDATRAGFGAALGAVVGLMAELGVALLMSGVIATAFVVDWLM